MSGPNSHSSAESALMHYYTLIQQEMHPNNISQDFGEVLSCVQHVRSCVVAIRSRVRVPLGWLGDRGADWVGRAHPNNSSRSILKKKPSQGFSAGVDGPGTICPLAGAYNLIPTPRALMGDRAIECRLFDVP